MNLLVWNQILPLLGVSVRENVLPAVVQCPLCQGKRGYVYHDPVLDGQWFYCHDCQVSGDMIELAAAVWKMNPLNTLRKAKSEGMDLPEAAVVDGAVDVYVKRHLEPRARAKRFWQDAKDYFVSSEQLSLRWLQNFLGVQGHLTPAWRYHGAEFIGAAEVSVARGLFDVGVGPNHPGKRGGPRFLKGPNWEDVIVIPFWDLPGRLCGFVFVGRQARVEADIFYHHAPEFMFQVAGKPVRAGRLKTTEAGVTMPMAVLRQEKMHDLFGNTMFVMDDPVLALRLQIRYMRNTEIPLALVGTYEGRPYRTQRAWDWLPSEDIVFWSPRQTTMMLRQAKDADAKISVAGVGISEADLNLRTRSPEEWFRHVRNKTMSWREALRQRLRKATPGQAEELLLELEITGGELREFISTCESKLAARLQGIHDGRVSVRKISYGKHVICEDEDGWSVEGVVIDAYGNRNPHHRICDVVVRIEHILRTSNDRSYYRGIVRFAGKTIPFTEKVETLDKGMWAWLKSLLAVNGLGAPTGLGNWTRKIMDIAIRFCQPDVIWEADVVGWDTERKQFNFPKFAIRLPGEVIEDHICLVTDPHVPGQDLVKPEFLGQRALQVLSEHNEETQVFWAIAACITSNVMAPALNFVPRGILLDGLGAQAIGAAAAVRLGCSEFNVPNMAAIKRAIQSCGNHHWPTLFRLGKTLNLNALDAWLSAGVTHQVIFKMPTATVNVLGIRQQWNIITCHRKLGSMQLVKDVAPQVLPAYVRDICARRLWVPQNHPDETDNTLDDMSSWFHRQGGDPTAVLQARRVLRVPGQPLGEVYFMELIRYLYKEGRLVKVQQGFDNVGGQVPKIVDHRKQNQIWIPQRNLIDLVEAIASIPLDLLPVTHALEQCGCLQGEVEQHGKMGWTVDAAWFDKQWDDLEAQHTE